MEENEKGDKIIAKTKEHCTYVECYMYLVMIKLIYSKQKMSSIESDGGGEKEEREKKKRKRKERRGERREKFSDRKIIFRHEI